MQLLDTLVLLSGAECSVVLGTLLSHEQNQGHQGLCVPRATFLETTDVDGDPQGAISPIRDGGTRWGMEGFGMEIVAVLPMGSKPGNPASALDWASSMSGPSLCHHCHWGK